MPKLIIVDHWNDEVEPYFIETDDGVRHHLVTANHDDHAWSGMADIKRIILAMAGYANFTIENETIDDD